MNFTGKYSLGILLTFGLLALAMLYSVAVINFLTGTVIFNADKFFYSRIILWIVLLLIFLYSLLIEKNSMLIWEDKKYSLPFYIGAVLLLYLICFVGGGILNGIITFITHEKMSSKLIQLQSIFKNNYFLIFATCITAGVVEELLMRGYIQPRIEKIYNSPFLGILISALLFGILHSTYGTVGQIAVPFFIGLVFAVFYKRYSNIKILIICHFMYDFISLMIMNFIDIKHLSAF
ncbi:membrane protease YdiL (CAAX protease family) [Chryseobacterium sp. H1D6B]|uniref:CPBP family intramembrane glutamic endopeptidase n=1 Tax=Chryseobacterium sp. H1D6B TaxID=2940588 RepID=UPI0015C84B4B|nr:CPBP family intramembrane glutamic endopeptidase [Chryseobacterium sp. H1D6B]MDH6254078.1 membrane protease YdiL (CAAX protease family) [Chryseobacterium sp. H1D6B]